MKKLKHIFSSRSLIVWLFAIILVLTIPEVSKPSMSKTEAMVVMLCVDRVGQKTQVAATTLKPSSGKTAKYDVYSGESETLGEAIDDLGMKIGKELGFAQCDVLVLGEGLCEYGIMPTLDYMTRTKKVGRNSTLINCIGDIGDFAKSVVKMSEEKSLELSSILEYDESYLLTKDSSIKSFYRGYFSPIEIGIMPIAKISDRESLEAIEVQASDSEGQNSQQSQDKKSYLTIDGSSSVFKKGKKSLSLEPEQIKKLNLFLNNKYRGSYIVENVTDDLYNDADIVFNITKKDTRLKADFKDGQPIYNINVELTVAIEEVTETEPSDKFLIRNKDFLTKTAVDKLKQSVEDDIREMISFCVEDKADLIGVFRHFYHLKYWEFKPYIDRVGIDNYLNGINYEIKIKVNGEY